MTTKVKIAFMFPGQGSFDPGMGREIAANSDLFAPDAARAGDKDLGNCA